MTASATLSRGSTARPSRENASPKQALQPTGQFSPQASAGHRVPPAAAAGSGPPAGPCVHGTSPGRSAARGDQYGITHADGDHAAMGPQTTACTEILVKPVRHSTSVVVGIHALVIGSTVDLDPVCLVYPPLVRSLVGMRKSTGHLDPPVLFPGNNPYLVGHL